MEIVENIEEYYKILWIASGLLIYSILVIHEYFYKKRNGIKYDFATDPNAGQLFIISIIAGPLSIMFLILLTKVTYFSKEDNND